MEGRVPEQLYSVGVHGGAIEYVTFNLLALLYLVQHNVVYIILPNAYLAYFCLLSVCFPSLSLCVSTYIKLPHLGPSRLMTLIFSILIKGCNRSKNISYIIQLLQLYNPMGNNLFSILICFHSVSLTTRDYAVYHLFHHVLCFGSMVDYPLGVKLR